MERLVDYELRELAFSQQRLERRAEFFTGWRNNVPMFDALQQQKI